MGQMIKSSVRNLIEFVMRSGDIDNSYRSQDRAMEGIIAHNRIQKSYGEGYSKEVPLSNILELEGVTFSISGRSDGIYVNKDECMIDEIKSTTRNLDDIDPEYNPLHWAQAKTYGYFYSCLTKRSEIDVQLTYVNIDEDFKVKKFKKSFSFEELEDFYKSLLYRYLDFSRKLLAWRQERNKSLKDLPFPYQDYRKGQRVMSLGVYHAIVGKNKLFIDAPTGIGKTMSAIFPSAKSLGEDLAEKIFYLTARSTTKKEAMKAMMLLEASGAKMKTSLITSKEKSCLNEEKLKCNPRECPFAKGHFDRVNDAILDLFGRENFMSFEVIEDYALKHRVCPFELSLDISMYSDIIICDYNYAFDPAVYLRRYFDDNEDDFIFLVDEAHNLVDRSRDMYSCSLSLKKIKEASNFFPLKKKKILKSIDKLKAAINELRAEVGYGKNSYKKEFDGDMPDKVKHVLSNLDKFLGKEKNAPNYDQALDFYFYLNEYMRIADIYQEGYLSTYENTEDDFVYSLKCIDTSNIMKNILKRARASIFFSATLTPMDYYIELLGGDELSLKMHLDSPFDRTRLLLLNQATLSTRYRDRDRTGEDIAEYIYEFIKVREGNYLIFFPSYAYLEKIADIYKLKYDEDIVLQERYMNEDQRYEYIESFKEGGKRVCFAVLGGLFSEGIDLVGSRLIGACIVSVGMPGLSYERQLIQNYFDEKESRGFDYAFTYPGINKVLQGAGRVIRSEKDKGCVLLIDDRFNMRKYRKLYPKHWSNMKAIGSVERMRRELEAFWSYDLDEDD